MTIADEEHTVTTEWKAETTETGGYAAVNGMDLYYETHGSGRPMILLHGGLGSGAMFGPTLPALAADHQVIAVDLQGTAARPTSAGRGAGHALAVLPGTTHYNLAVSPLFAAVTLEFLDGQLDDA